MLLFLSNTEHENMVAWFHFECFGFNDEVEVTDRSWLLPQI